MELTRGERHMIVGIQAREREIQEKYVAPLQADYAEIIGLIAERLGLTPQDLLTHYVIDAEALTVTPVAAESAAGED